VHRNQIWAAEMVELPSGKLTQLWKDPPFLMGKSTISMAMFNNELFVYQRVYQRYLWVVFLLVCIYSTHHLYGDTQILISNNLQMSGSVVTFVAKMRIIRWPWSAAGKTPFVDRKSWLSTEPGKITWLIPIDSWCIPFFDSGSSQVRCCCWLINSFVGEF